MKQSTDWKSLAIILGGLAAAGGVFLLIGVVLLLCVSMPGLYAFSQLAETEDTLLLTSTSPSGAYVLEAYRVNTAAIEPYYVTAYLAEDDEKRMVYFVRGQSEAEIVWLSDTIAQINGVPVDVTGGECFKANARGYFDVHVSVKAKDVQWLQVTVCMDGEERITRARTGVQLVEDIDAWGLSPRLNVLQELHWDDDLTRKKAGLLVTVGTADGQTIPLPNLWEWTAEEYGDYTFILTGSAAWGYQLTPQELNCTTTPLAEDDGAFTHVNSPAAP